MPNSVCAHKSKTQNISDGIFILSPEPCPKGGTLGRWECPGGNFFFVFKHGHVAYQIDLDEEQNKITVNTYTCRYGPISLDLSVVVSQTTGPKDIPHRRGGGRYRTLETVSKGPVSDP